LGSYNLSKIALAVLLTALGMVGISSLTGAIFKQADLTKDAFPIKVETAPVKSAKNVVVKKEPSLAALLAVASVERGQKVFKKCQGCHTAAKGAGNRVGPDLWDVVGRSKGGVKSFSYSEGMKAKGGNWTFQDLFIFLKKPKDFIAKTKMGFAGLKNATDRAAVIVLLRSFSDAPLALPTVKAPDNTADNNTPG